MSTAVALRVLGTALLAGAVSSYLARRSRYARWRRVPAIVIEIKREYREAVDFDDVARHMHATVFEYTDLNGHKARFQDPVWSIAAEYQRGDRVTLLCDPDAPGSLVIPGWRQYLLTLCLAVPAALLLIMSFAA